VLFRSQNTRHLCLATVVGLHNVWSIYSVATIVSAHESNISVRISSIVIIIIHLDPFIGGGRSAHWGRHRSSYSPSVGVGVLCNESCALTAAAAGSR